MKCEDNKSTKKPRIWELDFLRGIAILMVTWDHLMFNIFGLFGGLWETVPTLAPWVTFAEDYHFGILRLIFWPVFVVIFFFVSGICTQLSKNNWVRGLKLTIVAMGVSIVTYFVGPEAFIFMGVLHSLALSILLFALVATFTSLIKGPYAKHIKCLIYFVIGCILIIINQKYNYGMYQLSAGTEAYPEIYWTKEAFAGQGIFVYRHEFWVSNDYFALLPYFIYFMFGASASAIFYEEKKSLLPKLDGQWNTAITFVGKNSLAVYLAGMVLCIAFLMLVTLFVTGDAGLSALGM